MQEDSRVAPHGKTVRALPVIPAFKPVYLQLAARIMITSRATKTDSTSIHQEKFLKRFEVDFDIPDI